MLSNIRVPCSCVTNIFKLLITLPIQSPAVIDWIVSRMSWTVMHLALSVLCLSGPGSVIIEFQSGQGQMTDFEVLERGDD